MAKKRFSSKIVQVSDGVDLINERGLNAAMARHPYTKARIRREGMKRKAGAEAALAAHRHDGHAAIRGRMGRTDYSITLDDDRGQGAAISIEYGRKPYTTKRNGRVYHVGGMAPTMILRGGTGAAR